MSSKRILIADNDEELLNLLTFFLAKLGFQVVAVSDGQAALVEARKGGFDLILLDVMMPELDGYHAAAEISALGTDSPPKILIMTSRDLASERGIAVTSGADAVIQKPFKLADIKAKIETLLPSPIYSQQMSDMTAMGPGSLNR